MSQRGFTYTAEFGWFVCGGLAALAFESAKDRDWAAATVLGCLAVLLLAALVARHRSAR